MFKQGLKYLNYCRLSVLHDSKEAVHHIMESNDSRHVKYFPRLLILVFYIDHSAICIWSTNVEIEEEVRHCCLAA